MSHCHVCRLVLSEDDIQDYYAGRWTHRHCTEPVTVMRMRQGLLQTFGATPIYVRTPDEDVSIYAKPDMPVHLFRQLVNARVGPVERLVFHGRELDGGNLEDYYIKLGSTILAGSRRRVDVVTALQTVIRHEHDSTMVQLRRELVEAQSQRDVAVRFLHFIHEDIGQSVDAVTTMRLLRDELGEFFDSESYWSTWVRR
jgi:hypothetical protein